jgi:hypothetical protein
MKRSRLFAGMFPGVVMLSGLMLAVPAQQPSTSATLLPFEVATIRSNDSGDHSTSWGCHGIDHPSVNGGIPVGRCEARNAHLKFMIALAYGVPFEQMNQLISGGPNLSYFTRNRSIEESVRKLPVGSVDKLAVE